MSSPRRSPTKSKPVVSPVVRKGGGLPKGFDNLQKFFVYAHPKPGDPPIPPESGQLQGVWSQSWTALNPTEVWAFEKNRAPDSLRKSSHPVGRWGYSPAVGSTNSNKVHAAEDVLFIPPNQKPPKTGFIEQGTWTFPVMKRDETLLAEDEAGFLLVGSATKKEALDVGGEWKLLCHRPGTEKPALPASPKRMKVHVQKPNGQKITLKVKPEDTIGGIKSKVKDKTGIPKKEQRLRHNDTPLKDDKPTLEETGIKDGDVLHLEPMEIYVQERRTGNRYTLCPVEPSQTIADIKAQLEQQEEGRVPTPIPKNGLTFQKTPCQDDKTLKQHGIQHKSTLILEEPMIVHVKTPKGEKLTFEVEPTDTVESLQAKIQDKTNIPSQEQRLQLQDKPLILPKATLDDENIKHGDIIDMEPMMIFVKTPQGAKLLPFQVEPTDTIQSIKNRVYHKEDIPVEEQRMSFEKKELKDDDATLREEGIQHKDIIDLDPMHIIIKDWTGKKFPVTCEPEDTIDSIKDKIEAQEGHRKPIQYLIKGGNFLEDPKSLKDYGIKHKDVVNLDRMKIYVKDWKGKTFTLEVDPDEQIDDVKHMIEEREGHPVSEQVLKFRDDTLEAPKCLDDFGIRYKDTVDLSKEIPVQETPKSPSESTYVVQLTPYKSPFEQTYVSPKGKKREGVRAKTKVAFKQRWHTDLESEHNELARLAEEKMLREKSP